MPQIIDWNSFSAEAISCLSLASPECFAEASLLSDLVMWFFIFNRFIVPAAPCPGRL
jgi:hypothetical protein